MQSVLSFTSFIGNSGGGERNSAIHRVTKLASCFSLLAATSFHHASMPSRLTFLRARSKRHPNSWNRSNEQAKLVTASLGYLSSSAEQPESNRSSNKGMDSVTAVTWPWSHRTVSFP